MAKINVKNIENVEGEYHLMFFEGKNIVEAAKNDLRFVWYSLLIFLTLLLLFVVFSGFNEYYIYFAMAYLVVFVLIYIYLKFQKRKGIKQCLHAVKNSRSNEIVAKQVDKRKAGKLFVKSMSNTIDKYELDEKYPGFLKKVIRRHRQGRIAEAVTEFEKINESRKKK